MSKELNVNVSLDQTQKVECTCGNIIFTEGFIFRKASRILTGTAQDALIPINVFVCTKCGEALPETLPKNLPKD